MQAIRLSTRGISNTHGYLRSIQCLVRLSALLLTTAAWSAPPVLLDDQFHLPDGFHIYKAAPAALTGGSYVLCFDGDGNLLVGTGQAIHRLTDRDRDGVYDDATEIVNGLGPRGPQGILVHDDHLYAVGGDGVQHYTGYPDQLVHQGRLGEPFHTGGDHAAHTLLRGHDDWIYFVTGDGGGARDRMHITEETSPVLRERNASVFRFNLSGSQWECVSTGGRNPPSLGMNYLGELFSLDSDMEWHVDVPWYRPVRLNHWAVGADLGWQGVGAYPPYYIDTLPGVVDAGRGSPTWGMFYEHSQFPAAYHDAFIVCDYRWKSATKGSYNASGRLLSFALKQAGAGWSAEMEVLARPIKDAVLPDGQAIDFALVDVTVAPDGSLFITDHNQGIWRLYSDPENQPATPHIPPVLPALEALADTRAALIEQVLDFPQPQSEWTRLQIQKVRKKIGFSWRPALQQYALNEARPLPKRLRALRLISPEFKRISGSFFVRLAKSPHESLRAQAAWLTGLQGAGYHPQVLHPLLKDPSAFVRRRATEALIRIGTEKSIAPLIETLEDPDRLVRYTAMQALAHLPTDTWIESALNTDHSQRQMRALVASTIRRELPSSERIVNTVSKLISQNPPDLENQLDLLRLFNLFSSPLRNDASTRVQISNYLQRSFPSEDPNLRWEQARIIGEFQISDLIPGLLTLLESEPDGMTQFHFASVLSTLSSGWDKDSQDRIVQWLMRNQTGWFATFSGKGLQFPSFWGTVLSRFMENHFEAIQQSLPHIAPASQLGSLTIKRLVETPDADTTLIKLYGNTSNRAGRQVVLEAMKQIQVPPLRQFALTQLRRDDLDDADRDKITELLLAQGIEIADSLMLWKQLNQTRSDALFNQIAHHLDTIAGKTDSEAVREAIGMNGELELLKRPLIQTLQRLNDRPSTAKGVDHMMGILSGHRRSETIPTPHWIWSRRVTSSEPIAYFRKRFVVEESARGHLQITGDNEFTAFLDGNKIAEGDAWEQAENVEIPLTEGEHEIAIRARSADPTAGVLAALSWPSERSGTVKRLITNVGWEATIRPPKDWPQTTDAASDWAPARDLGSHGKEPWGTVFKTRGSEQMEQTLIAHYWNRWFENSYGESLPKVANSTNVEVLTAKEAREILLHNSLTAGDPSRGRAVYLERQCHTCHQGVPEVTGRIFGPDLAGVTRRLTREQLANAILDPSLEVADRFRATEVETKSGQVYSGFVTEQSVDRLVIATQTQIITLPSNEVESIQPLEASLMPEDLLNGATRQELVDLIRFLNDL